MIRLCVFLLAIGAAIPTQAQVPVQDTVVDYSRTRKYEIGEIRIVGAEHFSPISLIRRTGLIKGEMIEIPSDATAKAIRNLWELNLFSTITLSIEKKIGEVVFLRFDVEELPRLSRHFITGPVPRSDKDAIRDRLHLIEGNPVTESLKSRIRDKALRYYDDKGYRNATVEITEKVDTTKENRVNLYIALDRKDKVKIEAINFRGNEAATSQQLRRVMRETKLRTRFDIEGLIKKEKTDTATLLDVLNDLSISRLMKFTEGYVHLGIFSTSKFEDAKYRSDKNGLIDYYNSLGHRDATIMFDTVYEAATGHLIVDITIDEGPKYYFRDIRWEGNARYSEDELARRLGIRRGDVYNRARLEGMLNHAPGGLDVSSLYMNDGYLFFNVTPREVRVDGDSIDLMITIYEGPQAIIRNIYISGNTKTREHVIRRELHTIPGNKFSREDLIRSQEEIAALNLFDPAQLAVNPIPHPEDGTVDIEYKVVEKPSDQLELSAGYGGITNGLYGTAGVVFNNFSLRDILKPSRWNPLPAGDGQQLSFRIQSNGLFYQLYTFSFSEPWLGGKKPTTFTTSMNYSMINYTAGTGIRRDSSAAQFLISKTATFGLGKRLKWPDNYFRILSAVTLQNYNFRNIPGFNLSDGNANNFYISTTISRNSAGRNPNFPKFGSNVALTLQLTPPYTAFDPTIPDKGNTDKFRYLEYHKWRVKAEWFKLVAGSEAPGKRALVLRTSAKMGFLGFYNGNLGIPPFERFRMGGDGLQGSFTLQGYDLISLRGTEDEFAPVGGNADNLNAPIFNKYTVEMRCPLSLNPSSTIYLMGFLEGGNTYASLRDYDPFKLRRAAGVGVRVFLPMFGMLGFDYGIGFDEPGMEGTTFGQKIGRGAFHFRFGFEPE